MNLEAFLHSKLSGTAGCSTRVLVMSMQMDLPSVQHLEASSEKSSLSLLHDAFAQTWLEDSHAMPRLLMAPAHDQGWNHMSPMLLRQTAATDHFLEYAPGSRVEQSDAVDALLHEQ